MKINLILSIFILFHSSLYAQEFKEEKTQTEPIFASGMRFPVAGEAPKTFDVKSTPRITIQLDDKKLLLCDVDSASKTYICPNDGNPILVKSSSIGFSALGKNKDKAAVMLNISHIEADGKILYETPVYADFPGSIGGSYGAGIKINNTKDMNSDYAARIMTIDGFFETYSHPRMASKRKTGSAEYEKIVQSFMEEKQQIQDEMNVVYSEKNYSVELEDGQKINCERGNTRALSNEQKTNELQTGTKFQCGSFKCDPVKVDGKDYKATMLYESTAGSFVTGSIHLIDKDGIGPKKSVKKIMSARTPTPLVDNSYYLENAEKSFNSNYLSSMLPASLKQDREKISTYKDPNFDMILSYYKNICGEDNTLDTLLEGKRKLVAKLADLELSEFIQVLGDGSLVGQFVDPTLAPQLGCLYQGVYLNAEAAKNLNRLKKNIHPDKQVDQTISLARATELFNKAANMKDIAWKYKPDGCYARAHLMARRFETEGVRVDKVWIKGDLYVPGTEPLIQWNFHVAPIVYVEDGKGNIQKMVIDPSLFKKPVTVEEWDHKMSKKTARGSVITAFPFPENSAFMERSTLSFSSSDPYLPRDSINMNEDEKMMMSNETMRMYKTVEPK
ncbi:MAG: hypothetical protein H7336_02435 [Bacteriovorax sp.]|nr:hypothetical protein [Bacteriovorax sp.]